MQINAWHVAEAVVSFSLVEATAYFTGGISNMVTNVPVAAGVAAMIFKSGTSLTQIEQYANTLLSAIQGTTSTTQVTQTINNPQPQPVAKQYRFVLTATPTSTGVGKNLTLSVVGGMANDTWTCYEVENGSALTQAHTLDSNGNGQIVFNPVSAASAVGATLQAQGTLNMYAQSGSGLRSNVVTLTQA